MRYYIDTEFYEHPITTGHVIEPISYGVVAEDGREFYAEVAGFDWRTVPEDHFIQHHVRPHLQGFTLPREEICNELLKFTRHPGAEGTHVPDLKPEFWGYFADYDWVAIAWLFGRMVDLPPHFPLYCLDIKQEMKRLGVNTEDFTPVPTGDLHNALADARWHLEMHRQLREKETP